MLYTGKKRLKEQRYLHEFTGDELKKSLLPTQELVCPLQELITTGEAVFDIIRNSEMDLSTKNAFNQLERQFDFYKNLLSQ